MEKHLSRWEPFGGITRWGETLDQFFNDFWSRELPAPEKGLLSPAIDVSEDRNTLKVTAELPGLEKKDINVEVKDGVLTIRGEKKFEQEVKDRNYHRVERRYGSFYRALGLPDTVDSSKVDAAYKNGVLTVSMPKREETRPKVVPIKEE
jgi:HSP20 family protein